MTDSTVHDGATTLIDGEWADPVARRPVTNPADGTLVGSVGYGGTTEAERAADAAQAALPGWADTSPRARADLLTAAGGLLTERAEHIAWVLACESGKRLPEARGEVGLAAEYFRWFAEEIRRPDGAVLPPEKPGRRQLTIHRPIGVVASLTPWNFPVSIQARKLAPALAAGCTVVARASEKAPLSVVELVRCLHDAGFTDGAVNLVHGPAGELTGALLDHPAVRAVSFTGSTEIGTRVMAGAAGRVVRPLLELGGDAPFIVFPDADVDAAVEGAMLAKFRNNGESCIAANRFFVHEAVYDEFVGKLVERVDAMTVGNPLADPTPDLGPLIDDEQARTVTAMIEESLAAGARRLTRERELPTGGSYAAPTLLADVAEKSPFACEEIFGPAAGVFRFTDEEEVLARANATEMGLAAYAYTRDIGRVWRLGERLDAGIVGINEALPSAVYVPMGGVKRSGLGREGARTGLEEFQETRYLCVGL